MKHRNGTYAFAGKVASKETKTGQPSYALGFRQAHDFKRGVVDFVLLLVKPEAASNPVRIRF